MIFSAENKILAGLRIRALNPENLLKTRKSHRRFSLLFEKVKINEKFTIKVNSFGDKHF
jgi:hypothetical protein